MQQLLRQTYASAVSRLRVARIFEPDWLILFVWPLILLIVNRNWIFLNTSADDWMYFGYFHQFRTYLDWFSGPAFYYGTRLPWLLPGYFLYQVLPPIAANYALHLGMYYLSVFTLYGSLAVLVHRRVALAAALLMGSYSYFLIAMGTDYVNGPGIAYFLLSVFSLARVFKAKHRGSWLVIAGIAAAAMIYTNLFCVILLPGLAICCFLLAGQRPLAFLLRSVPFVIAGAALLTVILGGISMAFGGEFWFYRRSVLAATTISSMPKNLWVTTLADWPISNAHLVYPLIVLIICIVTFCLPAARARLMATQHAWLFPAHYVFIAMIMIFFQLRAATPVLQAYFYAGYLIPSMFLAIGGLLAPVLITIRRTTFVTVIVTSCIAAAAAFALRSCWEFPLPYPTLPAIGCGIVGGIAITCFPVTGKRWVRILSAAGLGAVIVLTPSAFVIYRPYYSFCLTDERSRTQLDENYQIVVQGTAAISRIIPEEKPFFWYDLSEQQLYHSISGYYLGPWVHISEKFPQLGTAGVIKSPPGTAVVLLSARPDMLEQANFALSQHQRVGRLLGQEVLQQGRKHMYLTIIRIEGAPQIVNIEQTLDFAKTSDHYAFLASGWSTAEAYGTWTNGPRAEIRIRRGDSLRSTRSAALVFDVPYNIVTTAAAKIAQPPAVQVLVSVNGVLLDTWNLQRQVQVGERTVIVPADVLGGSDAITIVLEIREPHSPYDLGFDANDRRQLGIALRSIRFVQSR